MDARLDELARARGGILTVADEAHLGLPAGHLSRAARRGELVAVRRGAYALAQTWTGASDPERYALRTRAALRTRVRVAASHHAALVLAGLGEVVGDLDADWGHVDVVSVGNGAGRVRTRGGLSVHPQPTGGLILTDSLGDAFLDVASALIQVAREHSMQAFAVALDQALRRQLTSVSEVWSALARAPRQGRWSTQAREVVLDADPLSPSPAATRLRIVLADMGFQPRRRVPIRDVRTRLVARPELLIGTSIAVVRSAYDLGVLERLREVGVVVAEVRDADAGHPERVAAAIAGAMAELSDLCARRAS